MVSYVEWVREHMFSWIKSQQQAFKIVRAKKTEAGCRPMQERVQKRQGLRQTGRGNAVCKEGKAAQADGGR